MKTNRSNHRKQSVCQGFAWQSMEEHLPENLVQKYKEAFQVLDREKAGKISLRDLSMVIFSIGIQLTEPELLEFTSRVVEVNDSSFTESCLGFQEFLAILAFIITECVTEEEASRIFQQFDKDGDGYISAKELEDVLTQLGDDVSDEEVQEMMKVADVDGDGLVSLQEFIVVMNSAHTSCSTSTEHGSLPRILIEQNNPLAAEKRVMFRGGNSWLSSSPDQSKLSTIEEVETRDGRDLKLTRRNSISVWRSCASEKVSEKDSVVAWSKSSENNNTQKTAATLDSEQSGLSTSFNAASNCNVKKRRKSSITRTLRNGRDAIVATARTLRRISR